MAALELQKYCLAGEEWRCTKAMRLDGKIAKNRHYEPVPRSAGKLTLPSLTSKCYVAQAVKHN